MDKLTNYKDLRVWQEAMELAVEVYALTFCFPQNEQYGLISQLRRASAHGVSNGNLRLAQGGKFEHGFFAGFVSSGVSSLHLSKNIWVNTAISSAVGGTSETIGGGKFMNGAITGAYTFLFNHYVHLIQTQPTLNELSVKQTKALSYKISEVAFAERLRAVYNKNHELPRIGIQVNVDIGIQRDASPFNSNIYTVDDLTVRIGNKSITIDVLYSVQNDMIVTGIREPYNAPGTYRYWLQSSSHKSGFLIQINFRTKSDCLIFDRFVNGHLKY